MTTHLDSRGSQVPTWKRAADLLTACVLLATLGPITAMSALAVRFTMGRPVFFYQRRTGLLGRTFQVAKLRTMAAGRRHDPTEKVPLSHPDITPLGRILRRFKLDEVPQLVAVLRGDMSLVGPRPALPEQTARYGDFSKQRLGVRPGLTGLAQIHGGALLPWPERIRYDVYYARNVSPLLDLEIVLKTIAVVLFGERRFVRAYNERGDDMTSPVHSSPFERS